MKEIRSLTGIRGIAATGVLLLHYGDKLSALAPFFILFKPLYNIGYLGVDLFFILSGFIITNVYSVITAWNREKKIDYLLKRFCRIYPIHAFTLLSLGFLVLSSIALGIKITGNYSIKEFIYHALLLQALPSAEASWNYPSWSISAEFFAYLFIYPITVFAFKYNALKKHSFIISITLISFYALFNQHNWLSQWNNIARISFEFASGAALFHALNGRNHTAVFCSKLMPILTVILLIYCYIVDSVDLLSGSQNWIILSFPLFIAGLYNEKSIFSRIIGTTPLRYLGLISYSLYMSHAIVEKVLKVVFPLDRLIASSLPIKYSVFFLHLLIPYIVASILYHFIEEPFRRGLYSALRKLF